MERTGLAGTEKVLGLSGRVGSNAGRSGKMNFARPTLGIPGRGLGIPPQGQAITTLKSAGIGSVRVRWH